jgi:CubicO group peptidase (beta-lactamase class C family)
VAAQVCAIKDGEVILDQSSGCGPGSLFLIFSAGKPFVAMLVHLLAERGLLGLDDPVARYWPEFGCSGKEAITIRQVLQHRSGLPPPLWPRRVPVRADGPDGRIRQLMFNNRAVRQAVIPAATISSTARDLARFYQMLLRGGELDGVRVLAPATIEQARQPSSDGETGSDGETDRLLKRPIRWSQGFQLGGSGPMGGHSSREAFGHNGSNCCIGWADPGRQLVLAYVTSLLTAGLDGSPHQGKVSDAILGACD